MRQRVLGFKCKTPDCKGIIPLPAARATVFPSGVNTVVTAACRHCHTKHKYVEAEVIDTGYEIIATETE